MPFSPIRILVVEDYEPFQHFLCCTIQRRAEWQVIGEVADGLEAIHRAGQLQPDLVLLDIGLPTLTGIEAARQIRAVSPNSKILFVSQESSQDIVQAAVETGALGYVTKSDAGSELIPALDAVLLGRKYLSRTVAQGILSEASTPAILRGQPKLISNLRSLRNEKTWNHQVGFYANDQSTWEGRINFVAAALKNGNAAIVIATPSHHNEFLSRLRAYGIDVASAIAQGRYISQDVNDALHALIVHDLPDPDKFSKIAGELIARAAAAVGEDANRVFVCGEGTTLLWEQGNEEAVVRLEQLWDEMSKDIGVQIHCGYLSSSFHAESGKLALGRICREHSIILSL